MKKETAAAKIPTFEEALIRLEKIVETLENGDMPLDESMKLFEEGTKLSRYCSETLAKAEQKITVLTKDSVKESESGEA
jgi:exodeoxyribonuclease VII small subunit